jgi:CRISPR system Cascade subunit CasA
MTTSFVLSEQPWIPCTQQDGTVVELSTLDCLVRAHELHGVADASPLVTAALHRHLLAVLHRSYDGPRSMKQWAAIVTEKSFNASRVGDYLGRVRERLDLFHDTTPFAQTPGLLKRFPDFIDAIDSLEIEGSSFGSASRVFAHTRDAAPFTAARAARALLAHHAFATGGLVRKPKEPTAATAAPLTRSAVVLLRRETLFLTLVSNLLVVNHEASEPVAAIDSDAPSWETDGLPRALETASEPERMPTGWLHMLTWLSRRILLVHGSSGVTGWIRAVGVGRAEHGPNDPMVAYSEDEKCGLVPLGIEPDRAFWRDAGALFAAAGKETRYHRPRALDLIAKREADALLGGPGARVQIEILGLTAEKSKINADRSERLETVAALLADPNAREAIEHTLRLSDRLKIKAFTFVA